MRYIRSGRAALGLLAGVVMLVTAGCEDVTNPLLEVTDPDIINPTDVNTPDGAEAVRIGALGRLSSMTSGGESTFLLGGLLADEWRSGDTFQQRNETDQRNIDSTNSFMNTAFRNVSRTVVAGQQAVSLLREFKPAPRDFQGQMFFAIGFAVNQAAESFCSGIPFSEAMGADIIPGDPLSTQQAFERAVATFDSAVANSPDSARFRNAALVGKGRALLNQGKYAEAAAAVASVPQTFTYRITHSQTTVDNQNWALNNSARRYVVADSQGGNGKPFVTANDPRVPRTIGGSDFEGKPGFVAQLIWPSRDSAVTIASGIEAKLIIAEAQLKATPNDPLTWLKTLNDLRLTRSGLLPLVDPLTPSARVDLLFRERAFWMFGTGHRLGDMRRLIRQYQRGAETVFPTGAFQKGGNFGTDVTLPIPTAERNNPKYTTACDKTVA